MTQTFSGSKVRHGTASGFRKHQYLGEWPCDACLRAKKEYDSNRLSISELQLRNREKAEAQRTAYKLLARDYPDVYRRYYEEAKAQIARRRA